MQLSACKSICMPAAIASSGEVSLGVWSMTWPRSH